MGVNLASPPGSADIIIRVEGRFDFRMNQDFRKCYEAIGGSIRSVVVDLGKVDAIDSSALGMLLMMRDKVGADGKNIRLSNANATVKRVLSIAKFETLFTIS